MLKNLFIKFKEDLLFRGLKLSKSNTYPWKNRKEKIIYYDNLLEKRNRNYYKDLYKQEIIEEIHISLSKSFICEYLSYFFFIISLFISYKFDISIGFIIMFLSLFCLILKFFFHKKAEKNYNSINAIDLMINFIFDMN